MLCSMRAVRKRLQEILTVPHLRACVKAVVDCCRMQQFEMDGVVGLERSLYCSVYGNARIAPARDVDAGKIGWLVDGSLRRFA